MFTREGSWQSIFAAAIDCISGVWEQSSGEEEAETLSDSKADSHEEDSTQIALPVQTAKEGLKRLCPDGYQSCSRRPAGSQPDQACSINDCFAMTTIYSSPVVLQQPKVTHDPKIKRKLGSNKWDLIHDGIQAEKREAASCPSDYQLCPRSLSGGCCPTDRVCGTSSCFPISAAPASACGMSGYVACGIAEGGGCCPTSYSCAVGGCSPLPGVAFSETCGLDSYLCPSSLNYGCCKTGMACGLKNCYATSITTVTLIETFTTTDESSHTLTTSSTFITAETPAAPSAAASSTSIFGVLPKIGLEPTAIPKTSASSSPASGLSTAEIGGIIGGAVTLLVVIVVATFFILRRLNKAIRLSGAPKSRTSSSRTRSGQPKRRRSLAQDVDLLSIDPLIMTGSSVSPSIRHPSYPSAVHSPIHEVEANSPPQLYSPFSPGSLNSAHNSPYRPIAASESQHSTTTASNAYRNPSLDSSPPIPGSSPASYFDISRHQPPDLRDQNLRFGHDSPPTERPSLHVRNWSDASDISQLSGGSSNLIELDAGTDGERKSGWQVHCRRWGWEGWLVGGGVNRRAPWER